MTVVKLRGQVLVGPRDPVLRLPTPWPPHRSPAIPSSRSSISRSPMPDPAASLRPRSSRTSRSRWSGAAHSSWSAPRARASRPCPGVSTVSPSRPAAVHASMGVTSDRPILATSVDGRRSACRPPSSSRARCWTVSESRPRAPPGGFTDTSLAATAAEVGLEPLVHRSGQTQKTRADTRIDVHSRTANSPRMTSAPGEDA
jgi:hypothetical protein